MTTYRWVESPVGRLLLIGDGSTISGLQFERGRRAAVPEDGWMEDGAAFGEAAAQLAAYFAGELRQFQLQLAPEGTPFQRMVWKALVEIPFGETRSYGQLAAHLGHPGAARAVGLANGRNPIAIVVPCHRVIGSDGSLTGFGGGLDAKRLLLEHERRVAGLAASARLFD